MLVCLFVIVVDVVLIPFVTVDICVFVDVVCYPYIIVDICLFVVDVCTTVYICLFVVVDVVCYS